MKKFLVILAVLSLAQVFAAPNPNSPISSAQIVTQSMKTKKTPALRSIGNQRGGGAVTPGSSPKASPPGSISNTNQGTGVQGVAISTMTQLPVASSASGVAAAISGAANLPPLVLDCF